MAEHFTEDEIEEFRECFFFHAQPDPSSGTDKTPVLKFEGLIVALRSIGCVPTIDEVTRHIRELNGRVKFPDFLNIVHKQRQSEDVVKDILEGFHTQDVRKKGSLPMLDVTWILQNFGERLSSYEVDQLLQEGRAVVAGGNLNYREFVRNLCGTQANAQPKQNPPQLNGYSRDEPVPDY